MASRRKSRSSSGQRRSEESAEPARGPLRGAFDAVAPYVAAVGFALLLRAVVIDTFYVPSGSMLPTLLIGDHMFVNKFIYGARIPFTGVRLPALHDPERGDVVVFELGRRGSTICPLDRCPEYARENFVKRIVGMPGDHISVKDGQVRLNGAVVAQSATGEYFRDSVGDELVVKRESLGSIEHLVLDDPHKSGLYAAEMVVPEGHYFMLGDNRDGSNDSRGWGTVARANLLGPVMRIYWSWNNRGSWLSMLNPLTWLRLLASETRWNRIGMDVT